MPHFKGGSRGLPSGALDDANSDGYPYDNAGKEEVLTAICGLALPCPRVISTSELGGQVAA